MGIDAWGTPSRCITLCQCRKTPPQYGRGSLKRPPSVTDHQGLRFLIGGSIIGPIFTLGSVNSASASGAEQTGGRLKQIIQTEHTVTLLRIPTGRKQTSWLFTSVVEDFNSGLPRNKSR